MCRGSKTGWALLASPSTNQKKDGVVQDIELDNMYQLDLSCLLGCMTDWPRVGP